MQTGAALISGSLVSRLLDQRQAPGVVHSSALPYECLIRGRLLACFTPVHSHATA